MNTPCRNACTPVTSARSGESGTAAGEVGGRQGERGDGPPAVPRPRTHGQRGEKIHPPNGRFELKYWTSQLIINNRFHRYTVYIEAIAPALRFLSLFVSPAKSRFATTQGAQMRKA